MRLRSTMKSIAGGLAAAFMANAAWAADFVILDSTAAGIEAGIVVDGEAEITIPDGAQIVVIDPAGETRMVDGPFTGRLSAAAERGAEGLGTAIDSMTTTRGEDTKVLGAVRSPTIGGGSVTE